ncbi:MAG: hypothetical protein FWH14_03625 [Oscillospiraceae bacterium]|nr:hypothetical protein [Oscillospiraceae bacterium]
MANEYSGADIMSMQQDAVRRVKEMQRRSSNLVGGELGRRNDSNRTLPPKREELKREETAKKSPEVKTPGAARNNFSLQSIFSSIGKTTSFENVFKKLGLSSEHLILIALIIVLLNEGADITVILALGYLLL